MYTENKYKEQGNGADSWTVTEWEDDTKKVMIDKYMTYEDPKKKPKKTDLSNIDIDSLTDEDIDKLRQRLAT